MTKIKGRKEGGLEVAAVEANIELQRHDPARGLLHLLHFLLFKEINLSGLQFQENETNERTPCSALQGLLNQILEMKCIVKLVAQSKS